MSDGSPALESTPMRAARRQKARTAILLWVERAARPRLKRTIGFTESDSKKSPTQRQSRGDLRVALLFAPRFRCFMHRLFERVTNGARWDRFFEPAHVRVASRYVTGNKVSCREHERYVAVSQSVRDRESRFTSQVNIDDCTVQVRVCNHIECVNHGR